MRLLLAMLLATFAADQALKWFVVVHLELDKIGFIEVWPGVLNLAMAWNQGINFGLLATDSDLARWLLIALALAITGWVIRWTRTEPGNRWMQAAAGLLAGGALGNVVDRLRWGAVADFLNVSCCGWQNPWAFNLADAAIFVGAIGLILASGRQKAP